MCRYAYKTYKSHFACFECRKAFKKTAMRDFYDQKGLAQVYHRLTYFSHLESGRYPKQYGTDYAGLKQDYIDEVNTCPDCGNPMAAMGFDFKAPAQKDAEAWAILREMYEHGFNFRDCGCDVGYKPPRKLSEMPDFLARHSRKSDGEKLLAAIAERHGRA